jgi:hypothetical protein
MEYSTRNLQVPSITTTRSCPASVSAQFLVLPKTWHHWRQGVLVEMVRPRGVSALRMYGTLSIMTGGRADSLYQWQLNIEMEKRHLLVGDGCCLGVVNQSSGDPGIWDLLEVAECATTAVLLSLVCLQIGTVLRDQPLGRYTGPFSFRCVSFAAARRSKRKRSARERTALYSTM